MKAHNQYSAESVRDQAHRDSISPSGGLTSVEAAARSSGNGGVTEAAQFLLDRLDEFDPGEDEPEREYHGHVAPAIARLRSALTDAVPQSVPVSITDLRQIVEDAIRTFCQSLGAGAVSISSDSVERIYYAGINLKALSAAVTLALPRPAPQTVKEPAERCLTCGRSDAEYKNCDWTCNDPWHADAHLRRSPVSHPQRGGDTT